MALHGPQGDLNGALLDDGTIVRLPPPETDRFASLLQPGQTIVAEGTKLVTAMGKVLDAQQIGASRERLSLVETAPGPAPGAARRRVPDLDHPIRPALIRGHSPRNPAKEI